MERTRLLDGKGFDDVPGEADSANIGDDGTSTVEDVELSAAAASSFSSVEWNTTDMVSLDYSGLNQLPQKNEKMLFPLLKEYKQFQLSEKMEVSVQPVT